MSRIVLKYIEESKIDSSSLGEERELDIDTKRFTVRISI